mgnify:CR=1 FL=1
MIGLIVTGHGNFASGLTSSLKLIAGEPKNYVAVDFLESYSVDDLERELTKALDELKDCEAFWFCLTWWRVSIQNCSYGRIPERQC